MNSSCFNLCPGIARRVAACRVGWRAAGSLSRVLLSLVPETSECCHWPPVHNLFSRQPRDHSDSNDHGTEQAQRRAYDVFDEPVHETMAECCASLAWYAPEPFEQESSPPRSGVPTRNPLSPPPEPSASPASPLSEHAPPPKGACVVCLEVPADSAVVPCGHMCACHTCLVRIQACSARCPVCRGPVTSTIKIYRAVG